MALAVGKKMVYNMEFSNQYYALIIVHLVCWLGLLHKTSTSFSMLVPGLCMLYHNF
jgi:hypothetical protein